MHATLFKHVQVYSQFVELVADRVPGCPKQFGQEYFQMRDVEKYASSSLSRASASIKWVLSIYARTPSLQTRTHGPLCVLAK